MFPSYYMTNSVKMANSSSAASEVDSSSATPVESKVDVLIIGAGPAGVMAANALAMAGVDVRIVDKRWVSVFLSVYSLEFSGGGSEVVVLRFQLGRVSRTGVLTLNRPT